MLFKPLAGQVRVSSETPVVVVVDGKGVHVPAYEHEDHVDEAAMDHICSFNAHELHL